MARLERDCECTAPPGRRAKASSVRREGDAEAHHAGDQKPVVPIARPPLRAHDRRQRHQPGCTRTKACSVVATAAESHHQSTRAGRLLPQSSYLDAPPVFAAKPRWARQSGPERLHRRFIRPVCASGSQRFVGRTLRGWGRVLIFHPRSTREVGPSAPERGGDPGLSLEALHNSRRSTLTHPPPAPLSRRANACRAAATSRLATNCCKFHQHPGPSARPVGGNSGMVI